MSEIRRGLVAELRLAMRNLGADEAQLAELSQMKTTDVHALAAKLGGDPQLLSILKSLDPRTSPAVVLEWLRAFNEHGSLFEAEITPLRKE